MIMVVIHTCIVQLFTVQIRVDGNINIMRNLICSYLLILGIHCVLSIEVEDKWNNQAQETLKQALNRKYNLNTAKNVILFLGDGMGVSTVSAARLYKAQLTKVEEGTSTLRFEDFPHVALSKTYNTDRQTPDSAGTGTAFLCGVKANAGTVGVNSNVGRKDCSKEATNKVTSIGVWSKQEGKSFGIVTTSRVTHATPAAAFAHSAERGWENDAEMVGVTGGCIDIARQLVEDSDVDVVLGGGRRNFLPVNDGGRRLDNRTLINDWETKVTSKNMSGVYVASQTELNAVNYSKTDNLLGLFASSHLDYDIVRTDSNNTNDEPSLAKMTFSAIQVLKKNPKGFFMLVEGARIDHGHHGNRAKRALHDTIAFDNAVQKALEETDEADTLIVVTADHSHVFSMAGYPETGNDILGIVKPASVPKDGLPYLSLIYGNGPGGVQELKPDGSGQKQRRNFTDVDTHTNDFRFHAAVEMSTETHSAEDVGIFANGPMAHLFHGLHEQNYIAHVMAYASCVGKNKDHCWPTNEPTTDKPPTIGDNNSSSKTIPSIALFITLASCIVKFLTV